MRAWRSSAPWCTRSLCEGKGAIAVAVEMGALARTVDPEPVTEVATVEVDFGLKWEGASPEAEREEVAVDCSVDAVVGEVVETGGGRAAAVTTTEGVLSATDGGGMGVALPSRMLALLELGTSVVLAVAAVRRELGRLRSKSVGMGAWLDWAGSAEGYPRVLLLLNQSITALAFPDGVDPACAEDQLASRSVELDRIG